MSAEATPNNISYIAPDGHRLTATIQNNIVRMTPLAFDTLARLAGCIPDPNNTIPNE